MFWGILGLYLWFKQMLHFMTPILEFMLYYIIYNIIRYCDEVCKVDLISKLL